MATTPNMGLVLPDVGVTIGPTWASELNAALESVDAHDHTNGAGRPVPVAGLDIDADLSMAGHGLTNADRLQVVSQAAPLSATTFPVGLYAVGGEAYWNDGAGYQVQLTNNGSVVGAAGTITGMLPTTSAAYNSGSDSFIFSNAGTLSGIEAGSFILRQAAAPAGAAITVAAPASGVTAYTLRVPATAPATVGRFWFGTTAGSTVTSTWVAPDASTVEVSGTTLRAKVGGILGQTPAAAGTPIGQVALGTIRGQGSPDNTRATVTGNVGLGTITGGSVYDAGSLLWWATGNIATGTITGGAYYFLATASWLPKGNIALGTISGQATPAGTGTITGNVALGTITGGDNGFGVATGNLAIGTVTGGSIFSGGVYSAAGNLALGAVTGGVSGAAPSGNIAYRTVATENLAQLAVTTAKVDDLAITGAKVAAKSITPNKRSGGFANYGTGTNNFVISSTTTWTTVSTAFYTLNADYDNLFMIGYSPREGAVSYFNVHATASGPATTGQIKLVLTNPDLTTREWTHQVDAIADTVFIDSPIPFWSIPVYLTATGNYTVTVQCKMLYPGEIRGTLVRAFIGIF